MNIYIYGCIYIYEYIYITISLVTYIYIYIQVATHSLCMHLQLQVALRPRSVHMLHAGRRAKGGLCGEYGPGDDASRPPS
jgi:hypothetical protein